MAIFDARQKKCSAKNLPFFSNFQKKFPRCDFYTALRKIQALATAKEFPSFKKIVDLFLSYLDKENTKTDPILQQKK